MLLAYIVYVFLLLFMSLFARRTARQSVSDLEVHSFWNYSTFFPIVVFSVVMGMRYDVGVDYMDYFDQYISNLEVLWDKNINIEPGYSFLVNALNEFGSHYSIFFVICSLIIIVFLYAGSRRFTFILPYLVYFIFTTGIVFHSNNIIRHIVGFAIYYYAIKYVSEKKVLKYIFFTMLAASFHKSFILFLPFYFLLKVDWTKSRVVQYLILFISILNGKQFINLMINYSYRLFQYLGYGHYIDYADDFSKENLDTVQGSGIFNVIMILIFLVIIFYSDKLKNMFEKYDFKSYYNLFFFGQIVFPLVSWNYGFERMLYPLYLYKFVILAFLAYFLIETNKGDRIKRIVGFMILSLYFLSFLISIYASHSKCSPFQFFFNFNG